MRADSAQNRSRSPVMGFRPPVPAESPRRGKSEGSVSGAYLGIERDRDDFERSALWQGPTLRELADRVEHQFGQVSALADLDSFGFARDEPLTPCDVYMVCDQLGVPAADFGVDV